jgi:hypothetical protein
MYHAGEEKNYVQNGLTTATIFFFSDLGKKKFSVEKKKRGATRSLRRNRQG